MKIVKDVSTRRSRVTNYRRKDNRVNVIPVNKKEEVLEYVKQELEGGGDGGNRLMQEYYNKIERAMKEAVEKYGKPREEITTNDKNIKSNEGINIEKGGTKKKEFKKGERYRS